MVDADFVFKNARVITMNPEQPVAELVAVKSNRIMLVADRDNLESVCGADTRIIDCQSKTIVPGFIDAHCHIFSLLRKLLSIDLSPSSAGSIEDIKAVIKEKALNTPAGEWIIGSDYNEFYLAEKRHPTRFDIDEVSPKHPVVLCHRSLHACVLNSRALSLAGINRETPEPPGALFERDLTTGELTGLLYEMLSYIRSAVMPPIMDSEFNHGVILVNRHFLSRGITSIQDATVVNDYRRWQVYKRLTDNDSLKSRLYFMPGIDNISQFREAGMLFGDGDNKLRLGGVKIMLTESSGALNPGQTELNRQALDIARSGFQLAIHAEEQSTVKAAITALEHVKNNSIALLDRRHRIEHCSECPPDLMEKLKVLKPVIVTQPSFFYYSGERYLATMSAESVQWLFRIGSWFKNGLVVAGSSDSPVVPVDPVYGLYAAVTRKTQSEQQITPEECISINQALAMYTRNAAYTSFEEDIKGSIMPGKLADMVLLSDDPTTVPQESIKDIKVETTIIDGKIVWEG